MLARIWSLSLKEFRHLRSDWWLPLFMLLGGALELLLVGWATSRPITNLPLIVLDHDRSPASRRLISALENSGTFAPAIYATGLAQVETALDKGEVNAAVIVPPGFASDLAGGGADAVLPVLLNGAESVPATAALRAIEGVTRDLGEEITLDRLGLDRRELAAFSPSLRVWFNESLSEAYYTTPAELALMLEFTVLLFAALSFSRERELGTLEQLLVMPFTSLEIIIGKSIPVVLIGIFDFALMLAMVHFFFGVPVRGSLSLLLILAFGYLMVELGKGMVISVVSRTQHQAFLLVMLVGMIDFMFTGYAAPVESMPQILQTFANLIPAHHWLNIVRGILLKGSTIDVLWPSILALAVLGTLIGTFSLRFVRRALD
jgi:ABC-2 type transport system permease protein